MEKVVHCLSELMNSKLRRWSCWSRDRHADSGAGRAQKPDAAERHRYMAKALLPIIDGGAGLFLH